MRTTITLDDDVEAALSRLRRDEGLGLSEALNQLVRRGLAARVGGQPYVLRSSDLGVRIDVTNIGDVLELLDEA
jgi:hypothetical protein